MRTALRLVLVAVAVVCPSLVAAQQTGVIPVPSVVRAGSVTTYKFSTRVAGTVVTQGKSMAVEFQGSSSNTDAYGTKDAQGLYPLTTTMTVLNMKGTVDGKPQSIPTMALPPVVLKIDEKGDIKAADSAGGAQTEIWKEQARQMAKSIALTRPPAGPFTVGTPISKTIDFPVAGMSARVQVSFLPTEVAEVGGEQAVKMQVTANSNFDSKVTQTVNGKAMTITTNGTVTLSGGMSVGLVTGETIRQAVTQVVVGTISVAGQQTAMQLRTVNEGYRVKQ